MIVRGRLVAFTAMFMLFGAAMPARAQLVLICASLHNDLANFDRRSHEVGGYYLPEIVEIRRALARAEADYQFACPGDGLATENAQQCISLSEQVEILSNRLWDRVLSPIGGSDPIRLRILTEMRVNRCPFPNDPAVDPALDIDRGSERAADRWRHRGSRDR